MGSHKHINQNDGGLTASIHSSCSYKQASPQFHREDIFLIQVAHAKGLRSQTRDTSLDGGWYRPSESPLPEYLLKKQSGKPQHSWHIKHLTALTEAKLRHVGVNSTYFSSFCLRCFSPANSTLIQSLLRFYGNNMLLSRSLHVVYNRP